MESSPPFTPSQDLPVGDPLRRALEASAQRHRHLCPRQVLGARIGLAGAAALGVEVPLEGKDTLVIAETDGCFLSGIEAATGAAAHHRTLRVCDLGKIAATFADVARSRALRVAPVADARALAYARWPAQARWTAMLRAYQELPVEELLVIQPVVLVPSAAALVSAPGLRVVCEACREEIVNQREEVIDGRVLCRACAGHGYCRPLR